MPCSRAPEAAAEHLCSRARELVAQRRSCPAVVLRCAEEHLKQPLNSSPPLSAAAPQLWCLLSSTSASDVAQQPGRQHAWAAFPLARCCRLCLERSFCMLQNTISTPSPVPSCCHPLSFPRHTENLTPRALSPFAATSPLLPPPLHHFSPLFSCCLPCQRV